jgi:nucleoside-diphosphate-sugar epimerase
MGQSLFNLLYYVIMQNTILIFGYGYTGSYVAKLLSQKGWKVIGTSSSSSLTTETIIIIPYDREAITNVIKLATHILISIPPDENGDIVVGNFVDLLFLAKNLKWIGYLSSTAVYGNHDGALVSEESALRPSNERAKQRIRAEAQWLEFGKQHKISVNIFRLAGIYGPKRNALEQLRNGKAKSIFKAGHVFSRIHVEDIARVIVAAIKLGSVREIYNLADDKPCPTFEVNNLAAELLGVIPPPIVHIKDAELSEMATEFYNDNKRISNYKIKDKLHIALKYPTFREGLKAIYDWNYGDSI